MKLEGGGKAQERDKFQRLTLYGKVKKRRAIVRKGKEGKFDVMNNVCRKRKDENVTRWRGNEPKGQIREEEQIGEGIKS